MKSWDSERNRARGDSGASSEGIIIGFLYDYLLGRVTQNVYTVSGISVVTTNRDVVTMANYPSHNSMGYVAAFAFRILVRSNVS